MGVMGLVKDYTVDLEMSEIHTVVPPVYECKFIPNSYHYW